MKHVLPYGTLELPDDWEDRSTYQFVSPPTSQLAVPLLTQHVNATRISVLLARRSIPREQGLTQFLGNQMLELRKALPGIRNSSVVEWVHPRLGTTKAIDLMFDVAPNMPVRQFQFYFPTPDPNTVACLTVSCNAAQYDEHAVTIKGIFAGYASPGKLGIAG